MASLEYGIFIDKDLGSRITILFDGKFYDFWLDYITKPMIQSLNNNDFESFVNQYEEELYNNLDQDYINYLHEVRKHIELYKNKNKIKEDNSTSCSLYIGIIKIV